MCQAFWMVCADISCILHIILHNLKTHRFLNYAHYIFFHAMLFSTIIMQLHSCMMQIVSNSVWCKIICASCRNKMYMHNTCNLSIVIIGVCVINIVIYFKSPLTRIRTINYFRKIKKNSSWKYFYKTFFFTKKYVIFLPFCRSLLKCRGPRCAKCSTAFHSVR